MNIIKKAVSSILLIALFPYSAMSATDPIKWTLTQQFPEKITVDGGVYVASYTLTSQMPFTMAKPLVILKDSSSPSEFAYNDLCTGKELAYQQSCTVTIYLNPTTPGEKTVQIIEEYGYNNVPLPTLNTYAANSGSNAVTGVRTTALPSAMTIGESAPWAFTFTNNGSALVTGINIAVFGTTYNTTCTAELNLNSSCSVQGRYTATAAGEETISVNFSYASGSEIILDTSTNIGGGSSGLVCIAAVPLASQTKTSSAAKVTLLCTNQSGSPIYIADHTASYPDGSGSDGIFNLATGGDNCTADSILPDNASCQLSGTYTAPSSAGSTATISLLVEYRYAEPVTNPTSSFVSTTTTVVSTINNTRTIHLINQCDFNVWWSMAGGAISDSPACASNSDCPDGSSCNISAKICYHNNYGPTTGSYLLASNGGTATTEIIESTAQRSGDEILWKGVISASTHCQGSSCQNNDCQSNGGQASCAPGVGFQQPATEAEFTLMLGEANNKDTYDISNVNGFSMPISMATSQTASVYNCGTAGNNIAAPGLAACNFSNITPPTNMYYWVSNTGTSCTAQNECADSGQICGLAFVPSTNSFAKMCGSFLGYWAANQICQTSPNFSSPFGDTFTCAQHLDNPFPANTYTLTQLLKCSPPDAAAPLFNSCYLDYSGQPGDVTTCCGCTNWSGIANPSAACPAGQTDPQWTTYVQPLVQWMKQACPTSYSYPYDDKASTFQCDSSSNLEYTITFCPGSGSGLPSGKTDGR